MKFYSLILFFVFLFVQPSFCQDSQFDNNKSELPVLNKGRLQTPLDVELYPNPSLETLNITLKNTRLKNVEFELYNVIGNKIEFDLETVNAAKYKVNVKEFNPGYYLLIVKDPISRYNKAFKFRKQ